MSKKTIRVVVAYARVDQQWVLPLSVTLGTTIDLAIKQSTILTLCEELTRENLTVGVFGEVRRLSDVVKAGDRIEIYRTLICDPKEARRDRAS